MSKERKFHQLIEDMDREEKNRVWQAIKAQEEQNQPNSEPVIPQKVSRRMFLQRAIAVASIILVLGGGIFAVMKLLPNDSLQPGNTGDIQISNSGSGSTENENRYCSSDSYSMVETEKTLKDLVTFEGKSFLYFDWYDVTDYCSDGIYQLNDSEEIIGYSEEIIDINTGSLVTIRIISSEYQLQHLELFENIDSAVHINDIQIDWKTVKNTSYAKFKYGGYDYYITLEYPMESDAILDLIQELLN